MADATLAIGPMPAATLAPFDWLLSIVEVTEQREPKVDVMAIALIALHRLLSPSPLIGFVVATLQIVLCAIARDSSSN